MTDTLLDWINLLVRWTHVIAGIAWIGSSFYFIALDAGLTPNARLDPRVKGEAWQVHGGGFYHIQKYMVAPEFMPAHLTWFKWEAYGTWIFGFALLCLTYFLNPSIYLIDPAVLDIPTWDAVPLAIASLVLGWFAYDRLCRSWFGQDTIRLALSGFVLLLVTMYAYTHVFSGRGAFIMTGALVGTIMAANVLMIIIPGQRKVVASLLRGEVPDPIHGIVAKQRSVHNNYLTLPVVFTMLSNHYAFTYASARWSWLILACIFIASFLVRHWFNTMHAGEKPDWRLWPAAAVPVAVAVAFSVLGQKSSAIANASAAPIAFAAVQPILQERCVTCHSARPRFGGFVEAPKGVMFDTPAQIQKQAQQIMQQAVKTHAMPLGNITRITEEERATLGGWISQGARL
ncbi:MAG: urate hydroxylase PuuD [Proteobacteria bacterium]|nr:urate hydroxylase PuuD [Pseudomonadota bacterium]